MRGKYGALRRSQLDVPAKHLDERVRPAAIVVPTHPDLIDTKVNDRAITECQRHVR